MGFGGRADLAAVVVGVAPFAVAHGPVAVAAAAARREARDNRSSDVGATVLENKKEFIRPQVIREWNKNRDESQHEGAGSSVGNFQNHSVEAQLCANS